MWIRKDDRYVHQRQDDITRDMSFCESGAFIMHFYLNIPVHWAVLNEEKLEKMKERDGSLVLLALAYLQTNCPVLGVPRVGSAGEVLRCTHSSLICPGSYLQQTRTLTFSDPNDNILPMEASGVSDFSFSFSFFTCRDFCFLKCLPIANWQMIGSQNSQSKGWRGGVRSWNLNNSAA